ncbi:MAG: tetratricopeptide repeat protein [Deltaproteobacteria bacterium]|nr:tetratricopeptide repeat protein [Deltaproteobacteria bacterium]MBW2114871.1 tetratricopeptide repeat protein [Deltaproteobacteria bacterium]
MYKGQHELKNEIKIDQAAVEQRELRLDDQRDYLKEGTVMGLSEKIYQGIQAMMNSDNKEASIWVLEKYLESYPGYAIAHNDLGVLYYNQGKKDKAVAHYEKAAQLQPENITFKKNLADFYYVELGRIKDALMIYLDILELHPGDIETLLITGHISVSLKRFEEARVFYNHVLKIEPWNTDAFQNLEKLKDYDKGRNAVGLGSSFAVQENKEKSIAC